MLLPSLTSLFPSPSNTATLSSPAPYYLPTSPNNYSASPTCFSASTSFPYPSSCANKLFSLFLLLSLNHRLKTIDFGLSGKVDSSVTKMYNLSPIYLSYPTCYHCPTGNLCSDLVHRKLEARHRTCLLYTSDAADDPRVV